MFGKTVQAAVAFLMFALPAVPALAQHEHPEGMPEMSAEEKAMMEAWEKATTPGDPHALLAEAEGEWTFTMKMWMAPDAPPQTSEGTATRRMILGGRHLEEVVRGEVMGQSFEGHGLTGYDNVSGQYWSTWVDNMTTGLMTMEGEFDEESKTFQWTGTSNDPLTGAAKTTTMHSRRDDQGREVTEFWEEQGGEKVKTMELVYTRK